MAENKGGSDLDVFEGLAKKKPTSGGPTLGVPTLPGAVPSQRGPVPPPPSRQKTLLGMPNLPPAAPSQRPSAVPQKPPSAPPAPPARASMPAPLPPQARPSAVPPVPAGPPSATPLPVPAPPAPQVASSLPEPSAAPSVPAATPSSIAAPVDMDWDDDDEKTAIFDKGETLQSLAPLPAAGAPAPGRTLISGPPPSAVPSAAVLPKPASLPPPAPRSVPPVAAPLPAVSTPAPVQRSVAPSPASIPAPSMAMPAPSSGSKTGLVVGLAVAGAALLGIGVFALAQPKEGKLAVFVAASGGRALDNVSVLVNGTKHCDTAPCRIELPKGVHEIKAMAPGYAPISQGVTVVAGEEQAVNLSLSPASAGTGLRVSGASGVTLSINGQEVGPLPQELKDLNPGQHTLLFKGGEMFADEERVVTVVADQIQDLGTVQLKLVRATARFDVRTPGASVTLVAGSERLPVTDPSKPLVVDASKSWRIEATKAGFEDFSAPLAFDGQAEKTFVVELADKAKPVAPVATVQQPRPATTTPPKAPATTKPAAAASAGTCTLNINSIPVSNVVLNGRPLGGTPKLGVSAPAGSHTVVFIHPEFGKKSTTTSCKAGETKTVAMRLNK